MATLKLLSLPTEVLQPIIAATQLEDFENLLLSCKQVYNAGQIFLAEHNSRRRNLEVNYKRWESDENSTELVYALVQLLRIFAADPVAARYIQHLTLCGRDEWDSEQTKTQFRNTLGCEDEEDFGDDVALETMIRESIWLQTASCDLDLWTSTIIAAGAVSEPQEPIEAWDYKEEPESLLPVLALVLTKLTNLKSLTINCDVRLPGDYSPHGPEMTERSPITIDAWLLLQLMSLRVGKSVGDEEAEPSYVQPLITGSPRCANDRRSGIHRLASSLPVSPMEKLSEVHCCPPHGYNRHQQISTLNLFITSPSIRSLYATNMHAGTGIDQAPYSWPWVYFDEQGTGLQCTRDNDVPDKSRKKEVSYIDAEGSSLLASREESAVEKMELVACNVDPQGIKDLINTMPLLTSLRYTHESKEDAAEADFDAGWFLRAIADKGGDVEWDCRMNPTDFFNESDGENDEEEAEGEENEEGRDENEQDDDNGDRDEVEDDDGHNSPISATQITDLALGLEPRFFGYVCTGLSPETLQAFTALETLSLDVRLFFGPTPESCERRDTYPSDLAADVQATRWDPERDTLRLIDVLPTTLKELELFVPEDDDDARYVKHWPRLIDGFREGRNEKLPSLTKFKVMEEDGAHSGALYKEISEAAGAEYFTSCDAHMSWRMEFKTRENSVSWD